MGINKQTSSTSGDNEIEIHEMIKTFGKNIRKERKEMRLTASELSKFLGLSSTYVSLLERGERIPSVETLLRICCYFGESVDSMLGLAQSKEQDKETGQDKDTEQDKETGQDKEDDISEKKRARVVNMINTFTSEELNYIVDMLKGLKKLACLSKG